MPAIENSTRPAFDLATVGAAVGLGSIWRLPYQTLNRACPANYLLKRCHLPVPMDLKAAPVGKKLELVNHNDGAGYILRTCRAVVASPR
jgi:hypothetical protein